MSQDRPGSADPTRPLRMLVVGSGWPAETFLERLYRGLAQSGIELWIASRDPLVGAPPEIHHLALPTAKAGRVARGMHGLYLGAKTLVRRPKLAGSLAVSSLGGSLAVSSLAGASPRRRQGPASPRDVLRTLPFLSQRFDLLYFPWNASAVRHLPLLDLGIPSLISCRGAHIQVAPSNPRRHDLVSRLPESFRRATAVHCVSRAILEAATNLGLDSAKATLIPPAVDTRAFRPADEIRAEDRADEATVDDAGPGERPFRLVTTGSLIWRKGLEYALRAVHKLHLEGKRVELRVLGQGPEKRRLLFTRQELGLEQWVSFLGKVDVADVAKALRRADAFVLPSLSEGISNAAIEAMACGLPVISSRAGGMEEAIEDGKNGLLVPLRDPEAMARAIARLVDEPGLARRLGKAARQTALNRFGLEQQIEDFAELCRRTAQEPVSSPASSRLATSEAGFPQETVSRNPPETVGTRTGAEPETAPTTQPGPVAHASDPEAVPDPEADSKPETDDAEPPAGALVLVVPTFPKLSETFVVQHFLGLLGRGWNVHVVCARSPRSQWRAFPELDDRPELARRIHVSWPTTPRVLAAALLPVQLLRCLLRDRRGPQRYLWRYLRRGRAAGGSAVLRRLYADAELLLLSPALVHFEFGTLAAERMTPAALAPGWLLDCKTVVSFRGYDLNHAGLEKGSDHLHPVWRNADGLHFLGRDLWERAQRQGCPPELPHSWIPPAVDLERFGSAEDSRSGHISRPLRILSVGRLEWQKSYEDALSALALLQRRGIDFEYVLLGDGEQWEALCFAVHQLGLDGRVHLLGARPPEEVSQRLREADVFLHLAVSEGFCNAVLEAQASCVPVVASDAGGLPENVADGETGLIVPSRDPAAAAQALERLARDPALRQRLGQAGRRRVAEHFRPQTQIRAFEELYHRVLAAAPRKRPE